MILKILEKGRDMLKNRIFQTPSNTVAGGLLFAPPPFPCYFISTMDLEHLNKKQVLLLSLLVSFVASIATGIVTVSLMEQAPPQVAATVNHIVERTVQQMVPVAGPATVSTTVKTVVVKNDDLAAQSIASVRKSIIRIVDKTAPDTLVARGIIVDAKGTAITDHASLDATLSYEAILADGSRVPVELRTPASSTSGSVSTVVLKLSSTTPALIAATFADPSKLALGQSVLRIGGDGEDVVGDGIISSLPPGGKWVQASVGATMPGSIIINLFGEVVGMTTTESLAKGSTIYSIPGIFKVATDATKTSTGTNTSQAAAAGAASGASTAGDSAAALPPALTH